MPEPKSLINTSNDRTEDGYTAKMRKNILGTERKIRQMKDEQLYAFDKDGNKVVMFQGKGAKVQIPNSELSKLKDTIMTHNHPRALRRKGIWAIGDSFSYEDIITAVKADAREIRAVTPTYTFSIKRPAGGWNATPEQIKRAYANVKRKEKLEGGVYAYGAMRHGKDAIAKANERYSVAFYHRVTKRVSNRFGWDYTKKNR